MIKNFKNIFLLASVFMTGMSVLVVEIVAMRVLSPYYGNTIFSTSAVISTVLAALAIGYYFGGRLSDRYPDFLLFYLIIFASGILIVAMHFWANMILPEISLIASLIVGPLIASILLFFIPAFLLGMLSPFAVKLNQKSSDYAGRQSGEIFFWSTLGSILGSLLTGFVFIPHLGIDFILIITGVVVGGWGLVGAFSFSQLPKKFWLVLCFIFLIIFFIVSWKLFQTHPDVVYQKDGVYEKIKIFDGVYNDRVTRFLNQDKSNSAAMYLASDELVYDYTKYYRVYQLINPGATSAFLIGGGAYSIPKALLKDSPKMQVVVTEIEPELYSLAQQYFNLEPTHRLKNVIEDGRQFLHQNLQKYDLIVSDVYYSFFSIPVHFTTKEFFILAKSRLQHNGVFVGNFVGDLEASSPSFIWSEIKTFKNIFPNSYFFAVKDSHSDKPQNIIFLGINGDKRIDFSRPELKKDTLFKELAEKEINISDIDFSKHQELTDNFAPTDYLVSRTLRKWY